MTVSGGRLECVTDRTLAVSPESSAQHVARRLGVGGGGDDVHGPGQPLVVTGPVRRFKVGSHVRVRIRSSDVR